MPDPDSEPPEDVDPPHLSFATDIKPLFRRFDRDSMRGRFDLWNYEEVKDNAVGIHEQVSIRRMPCDEPGKWNDEKIATFKRWMDEGCQP